MRARTQPVALNSAGERTRGQRPLVAAALVGGSLLLTACGSHLSRSELVATQGALTLNTTGNGSSPASTSLGGSSGRGTTGSSGTTTTGAGSTGSATSGIKVAGPGTTGGTAVGGAS
ncbi:MAG: hypothetical protein M3P04_03745, partial [Actinomycetota bacterium]|nr:hypothetical protein [Actinomycetota bacterium]